MHQFIVMKVPIQYSHKIGSYYGKVQSKFAMDSLKCDHGSERDVSLCQYSTRHDCTASEAAGLICKGKHNFSSMTCYGWTSKIEKVHYNCHQINVVLI